MDLETFLTTLYVLIDDWYTSEITGKMRKRGGPAVQMSDSEVLTVAVAGAWRAGVPWQSERGLVRYMHAHCLPLFPNMLQRSAFNIRVRRMWNIFILLQQHVADLLETGEDIYECVDCEPIPAHTYAQSQREKTHWLWESTSGHGGNNSKMFIGDHLLMSVNRSGVISGWLLAAAHIQDRWLMEVFLSSRAGLAQITLPARKARSGKKIRLPTGHIGPVQAAGHFTARPYVTDAAYNGEHWHQHWLKNYGATVIAAPQPNDLLAWSKAWKRWLSSVRQPIETAFAFLHNVFNIKYLNAHSRWGQYTRIAAKLAAYNIGLFINRMLGRPQGALETLIV